MAVAFDVAAFSPQEICALVNHAVIEEHAGDAAFLWRLRERAIHAPHYRLPQLALLDARVLAHLEGLRTAGADGLAEARRTLGEINGDTLFVAAYVAFAAYDVQFMHDAITIALSGTALLDALIAALSWQSLKGLHQAMLTLSRSRDPTHRRICLAVYTAQRADAGSLLDRSIDEPDPEFRACALKAVGELGRADLVDGLQRRLADSEARCRFWSAWSLALSGRPYAAQVAYETARDHGALSPMALDLAMRTGEPQWARGQIRRLAADRATVRHAIIAAGAFGDPAVVPWLLELTTDKQHCRVAAEAIACVTGADLEHAALKQDAPEDAEDGHPDDASLRWPNPEGLRSWWAAEQGRFLPGQRYLAGLPVSDQSALQVLRTGYQRQRRAAAIELARLRGGAMVFPVAARADWQKERLSV